MKKGYVFSREVCPVCNEVIPANQMVKHLKKEHPLQEQNEDLPTYVVYRAEGRMSTVRASSHADAYDKATEKWDDVVQVVRYQPQTREELYR
jgi:hypothetical protein